MNQSSMLYAGGRDAPMNRPSVLYAVAHDLRHDLDVPSIEAVAADRGIRFALAVAQAPYCAPSRNSFFTGRRTTVTGVHTFDKDDATTFAPLAPEPGVARPTWTAVPQAFAEAGYLTYGTGITVENFRNSASRCPGCWTDGYFLDWPDEVDLASFDAKVANTSIAWLLGHFGAQLIPRVPFFLMVGFHGGHKPWPLEPEVHEAHGFTSYTLTHDDLRLWSKPEGTGDYTSLEQTSMQIKHKW